MTRRRGRVAGIALLAMLVVAPGCSWFAWIPGIDGPEKTAEVDEPAELVDFEAEATIKRLWRARIGDGLGRKYLTVAPAVVADRVIGADAYGVVQAHDRFSGKRLWQAKVGDPDGEPFYRFWDRRDPGFVTGAVGAGDGNVLIGTTRGEVIALDVADGAERWRTPTASEVLTPPATGGSLVFAQTSDGRLMAMEGASGTMRWSFDTQVPILTLRGTATPVFADGVVYSGFASGKVSAVRADNGQPLWEQRVQLPEGRSELDRMVDIDAAPLVDGGNVYAVSYQGRLVALRRTDGALVWDFETSSYVDLASGYGNVYVVDEHGVVTAIDRGSADVVWAQDGLKNRGLTSPLVFGNYVIVGDRDGYLHVIAQSDGRFVARRRLDGDGLRSPMVVADEVVYVITNSGDLVALSVELSG